MQSTPADVLQVICRNPSADLPRWAWLWLGLLPGATQLTFRLMAGPGGLYARIFEGEHGFVENATALVLASAALLALLARRLVGRLGLRACGHLLALYAVFCLLLTAEELSWGQHWIGWRSPELFIEHNLQKETNLHNLSWDTLDWPWRLTWMSTVLFGGALPLWLRWRPIPQWLQRHWLLWLIPTVVCVPAAAVQLLIHAAARLVTHTGFSAGAGPGINLNEAAELYLAIFLLIYAASLHLRLRRLTQAP